MYLCLIVSSSTQHSTSMARLDRRQSTHLFGIHSLSRLAQQLVCEILRSFHRLERSCTIGIAGNLLVHLEIGVLSYIVFDRDE